MDVKKTIFWLGHAGFYIKIRDKTIFIDPYRIPKVKKRADILLITHPHPDHYSKEDIAKVVKKGTIIVCPPGCDGIEKFGMVELVAPGEVREIDGIRIEAVRAYNTQKERLKFHPQENDWVGYVIDTGEGRIYHAGDTDNIPEMAKLKKIDVALIPVGGTYTMDINQGIAAAKRIDSRFIVPMHYKMLVEDKGKFEEKFRKSVKNALFLEEVG